MAAGDGRRAAPIEAIAREALQELRARGVYRNLRRMQGAQGARMQVDGRQVVHFASSNYLDLAHHPEVVEAAAEAARSHGCAASGSRLICGNFELHEALEHELADFLGVEAALLYSSGYMANLGVLPCLLRPSDVVLSDSLNHASIVDACRLAKAQVDVFAHGDVDALEQRLRAHRSAGPRDRRLLVVLDGVYSMDGDVAPLAEMTRIAREYAAAVVLDDAHGFGTLGPSGRGSAELTRAQAGVDVYVGTLGKALGSFGAFVAGSHSLRELLVNASRTFVFTCALSAPQVAAARAALRLLRREPDRRTQLQDNAAALRSALRARAIATQPSTTHILPIVIGDNARTMAACERLLDRGFYAQGIRHPSVPDGTARLRATVMSSHTRAELDAFADAVASELVPH